MNLSVAIDFVLSLLLWFLLLSLVVSAINEAIARALALRSSHLWRALSRLLDENEPSRTTSARPLRDRGAAAESGFSAQRVYEHALVKKLDGRLGRKRARLSRIPAENFARALVDILKPEGAADASVSGFKERVELLPIESPAKGALLALASQAENSLTDLRSAIANWFDSSMEALSARYRIHVKILMVVIAFGVAWSLNADSVRAAEVFYRDEAVRTAASAQAVKVVDKCSKTSDADSCLDENAKTFREAIDLPIGWDAPPSPLWVRLAGWVITAVAASQGAPFWFDLLARARRLKAPA